MKENSKNNENNENKFGTLYIVSTPIGNLEDITFRAIKTLNSSDYILCEDTRQSLKLLNHYNISKKLISYHNFNESQRVESIISDLKNGFNISLVSDAGTPAISDPGSVIILECIKNNISVTNIVGANAIIPSIILSGLDCSKFIYWGFLNSNKTKKTKELQNILNQKFIVAFYETPHRIKETLEIINTIDPSADITIAKELTKIHESFLRGKAEELLKLPNLEKGEMVVVVRPNSTSIDFKNLTIEEHYNYYLSEGLDKKTIIKNIAKDRNVSKNIIFKMFSND